MSNKVHTCSITSTEIEYRTWITNREREAIQDASLQGATFDDGTPSFDNPVQNLKNMQRKTIETYVVRIGTETQNLFEKFQDLPDTTAKELMEFFLPAAEATETNA